MPFDLSLPLFAASGLALGAIVTYFGWPQIRMRTYNKMHGNLRVVEVAFILSNPARVRPPARLLNPPKPQGGRPGTEFVIYMTLKTGNL
jgi:hypothetical protein